MFERLKRFFRKVADDIEGNDALDGPQRANPAPPKDHWFKRVEDRSLDAAAKRDVKRLEADDGKAPRLDVKGEEAVNDLFARVEAKTRES